MLSALEKSVQLYYSSKEGKCQFCNVKSSSLGLFALAFFPRNCLEWYDLSGSVPHGWRADLPFPLGGVHMLSDEQWLLGEFNSNGYAEYRFSMLRSFTSQKYTRKCPLKYNFVYIRTWL